MEELTPGQNLALRLKTAMDGNGGKIPYSFIEEEVANRASVDFTHLTKNMRVCVIRLESGHEVLGKAQVIDAANDDQKIGEEVAFNNAVEEFWAVFGSIALTL